MNDKYLLISKTHNQSYEITANSFGHAVKYACSNFTGLGTVELLHLISGEHTTLSL